MTVGEIKERSGTEGNAHCCPFHWENRVGGREAVAKETWQWHLELTPGGTPGCIQTPAQGYLSVRLLPDSPGGWEARIPHPFHLVASALAVWLCWKRDLYPTRWCQLPARSFGSPGHSVATELTPPFWAVQGCEDANREASG